MTKSVSDRHTSSAMEKKKVKCGQIEVTFCARLIATFQRDNEK